MSSFRQMLLPLAFGLAATALTAVVGQSPTAIQPLQAQTTCDPGCDGNLCSAKCVELCPNGSCCRWDFYYVCKPPPQ